MPRVYQPLAVFGLSFGAALLIGRLFSQSVLLSLLIFFAAVSVPLFVLLLRRKQVGALLLIAAALMLGFGRMYLMQAHFFTQNALACGQSAVIEGKVIASDPIDRGRKYQIRTDAIGLAAIDQRQTVTLYTFGDYWMEPGERVRCTVTFFDSAPNMSQRGVGSELIATCVETPVLLKKADGFTRAVTAVWEEIRRRIGRLLPTEEGSLLTAMLLGDRTVLNDGVTDRFSQAGILHLLCISGFHITLISSGFLSLIQLICGKRRLSYLAGIPAAIFFVVLTGGAPSALRALGMELFRLSAKLLRRSYRPLNALGGTVLVLCLWRPQMIYHTGFLLSVLSVLTIGVLSHLCRNLLSKAGVLRGAVSTLITTLSVNFATLPITASISGSISLLAPLINLGAIPLFSAAMGIGLFAVCLAETAVGRTLGRCCELLLRTLVSLSKPSASGFEFLPLGAPFWSVWFAVTLILLLIGYAFWKLKKQKVLILLCSLAILVTGLAGSYLGGRGLLTMAVLQSRSGQSIVLTKDREAIVVGCGTDTATQVTRYLRGMGVRKLQSLILPADMAYILGDAATLLSRFPTKEVHYPLTNRYDQILRAAGEEAMHPLKNLQQTVLGGLPLTVRIGKTGAAVLLDTGTEILCFCDSDCPIPYPCDYRIFYDKLPQKDGSTEENCAIISVEELERMWLTENRAAPVWTMRLSS